jgi:hypothetical protein
VIILVAVLFFVSVYGVREGFRKTKCIAGTNYADPTTGTNTLYYYTSGCNLKPASNAGVDLSDKPINSYYGTPNSNNELTQFKTYKVCKNTNSNGNWTWETACS